MLCGSVVRDEDTPFSDLDLVIIFDELDYAYRESLVYEGWPVEAFVPTLETIAYFFEELDGPSGCPSLPNMAKEGLAIPIDQQPADRSETIIAEVKRRAAEVISQGPSPLSPQELRQRRYELTDFLDDLRAPRNAYEARATGTYLYQRLADFWFRSQGLWSTKGKNIPKALYAADESFATQFIAAFDNVFIEGKTDQIITLTEKVLEPFGGTLLEGYRLDAPKEWKK